MHVSPLKHALCAGILLATAVSAFSAPQTYSVAPLITFDARKGNWSDAKNWKNGAVPKGFVAAGCRIPATITLNSAVPEVFSASFAAEGKPCKLYINDGAKLLLQSSMTLHINKNGAAAEVEMTGGDLEMGRNGQYAFLGIATSATFSTTATMTISGGTVKGSFVVGERAEARGSGRLVIKGAKSKIQESGKNGTLSLEATGTLEFILDEGGVSAVNYPERTVSFKPGSQLKVDASQYRGSTKRIPLIVAGRFAGIDELTMTITNQPARGTATFVVEKPPAKQPGIYLSVKN